MECHYLDEHHRPMKSVSSFHQTKTKVIYMNCIVVHLTELARNKWGLPLLGKYG
ncbi:hypothetical protein DPMN_136401 [Dreissena polymorpha]|uniref:Uncharacterized protein n=1 Tax=Dreissena polymorpha TaxID=45954 RepID=A0A9D3YV80_DREPO|nr:hypothetical protein DPMN_080529 [Dreissena polymorpha]KAH3808053.1 hypothetical protein DPMN_136401 [Dreissena polymorpha]